MKEMMGILLVLVVFGLSACGGPKEVAVMRAAVPEQPKRLEYTLTADTVAVIEEAVAGATCLLRRGWQRAQDCRAENPDPVPCNHRSADEIAQLFQPVFETLVRLRLSSPFVIKARVPELLPDAFVTDQVYDARREMLCNDWRNEAQIKGPKRDGACLAVRYDDLWILLHAPLGQDNIDWIELFLAKDTCEEVQ